MNPYYTWTLNDDERGTFLGAIRNQTNGYLDSPALIDKSLSNTKFQWQLKMRINKAFGIEIDIHLVNADRLDTFSAEYTICIYLDNTTWCSYKDRRLFNVKIDNHHKISYLLSGPKLYFQCPCGRQVEPVKSIKICFSVTIKTLDQVKEFVPTLQEIPDFEKLLDDPKFSDFVILSNGKSFKVHKNILAARSEVFSTMFEVDMREKKEGRVEIEDFTPEVVQELLRFMYCGKVNNLNKISVDLLKAADKYSVKGLGDLCLERMCDSLYTSNAVEYLSIAIHYKADAAKSKIINFIVLNLKHINSSYLETLTDSSALREILTKTMQLWL